MPANGTTPAEIGQSDQELVDSKRKIKKIRIIVLVLAILLLGCLVAVAVIFILNNDQVELVEVKGLELEDILRGNVSPKRFNGTWTPSNTIIYKDIVNGFLWEYDVLTRTKNLLTKSEDERVIQSFLYEKSADNQYLLIARAHSKLFRHSFTAIYYVVELRTGKIDPLTINGEEVHLLLAKWAPTGNGLIINYDRNLYYKPSVSETEIPLTTDTNPSVLNGHPDWVYEEEVFGSNVAVWMNPNSTKLAYIQFDDSSTHIINLPFYGFPGDMLYQYPFARPVAYPKAGSSNPFIKLHQIDLNENKPKQFDILVPGELNTEDHIITSVDWLTNDLMLSIWMNRIQNRAYLQVSNNTHRYQIYSTESKTGWVDLFTPPVKNKDGTQIALILPQRQDPDGEYFRHLCVLSTKNIPSNRPVALTNGKFIVQQIHFWDYKDNVIFYMANLPEKPQVLHLFAIVAEKNRKSQCLTCGITLNGVEQTYFTAEFSPSGKYIILTSLGPSIPKIDIYEWILEDGKIRLKLISEWENNDEVKDNIAGKQLPEIEYHTVDIGEGFTAKVLFQLPPNIDRSGRTKYPMLVDVYGGPDSYSVVDKWTADWGSYLASNRSIIYAKIDGRGSGLRGERLLHSIYLKLGTFEVYDQINVTKKLQQTLPYVDEKRTGIWGWSYGGYASAMALANDYSGVFSCAASVAPVTDWAYYDSIYTERYMGLPSENAIGYEKSRLTALAGRFKGKKYFLIHGTLDDNVHYQQAAIFEKSLQHHDILFKETTYPDEDHGLINVRPHLYHSLNSFFEECFNLKMDRYRKK